MEVRRIFNTQPTDHAYDSCYGLYKARMKDNLSDEIICTNCSIPKRVSIYWSNWCKENYVQLDVDTATLLPSSCGKPVCVYLNSNTNELTVLGDRQAVYDYISNVHEQFGALVRDTLATQSSMADLLVSL